MKINIPPHVKTIIGRLEAAGFEAYAVGGCVRDSILGRTPEDWDITTSAKPEQVKALFARTVDTGIRHGTVTVLMGGNGYEVTTYRIDGEYRDGRHPKNVEFTASLKEDLRRRDFTINAMAYNPGEGLIDVFGGMDDLKAGVIRCVGSARERFKEDALRLLRAVRFSAQLGFSIEEETEQAVRAMTSRLEMISRERIRAELDKLLTSPHPEYFRKAWELGITAAIMPEFDVAMETPQRSLYHTMTVGEHILETLKWVRPERVLRWTMLFHDLGKPQMKSEDPDGTIHFYGHAEKSAKIAGQIMKRLKFDNAAIHDVTLLVTFHDFPFGITPKGVRRAMNRLGELFPLLLEVCTADSMGKSRYAQETYLPKVARVRAYYEEIKKAGDCVSLKDLAIHGGDLIAAGFKPGKEIGKRLGECLDAVMEDPGRNNREYLIEFCLKKRRS